MAKIVILGSGGWGIALAITAYNSGNDVTLWTPFENEADELLKTRASEKLLKGITIPEKIGITTDINSAEGADITIIATPSFAVCETAERLSKINNFGIVVNVAKGLEGGSGKRLSEAISERLPNAKIVVLSGPSHAEEVARHEPTSLVAASKDFASACFVQETLMCETLRIYTCDDLVGVELGGAFKNVIAVASGIGDGLSLGDNPKAALITRGLAEIARLGSKLGAKIETFTGLSGLGDLIVTCTSVHSRNYRFGKLVGKGVGVEEALKIVGTVEGYHAAKNAYELAQKVSVEMPIIEGVYAALYEGFRVEDMVKSLMNRPKKTEHENSWLTNE